MKYILNKPGRFLLWAVGLLTAVLYAFMPFSGDDYAYKAVWHYPTIIDAILHYPGYILFHWYHVNGRLANFIASPLLNLCPHWLLATLCGAAIWLMLYMSLRWSGTWRNKQFFAALIIGVVMLAFPWWDAMQIFDCQFNYIWTSAFVLVALWFVVCPEPIIHQGKLILICMAAFAGAMMHESASLPLLVGGVVWLYYRRGTRLPKGRIAVLTAFVLGSLIALSSPGIWLRAGSEVIPNDSLPLLFLKSFSIVGVLWIVMIAAVFSPKGRQALSLLRSTPLLILAVATVPAVIIGLKSGIVGRTGWFGSLYALIVLIYLLQKWFRCSGKGFVIVAWCIALVVISHLVGTILWQAQRGNDHYRFEKAFRDSPDGIVYLDHLRDTQIPWWTLSRTRGVPDPDDVYLMECFRYATDYDAPYPIVLPSDAFIDVPISGSISLRSGDVLTDILPDDARPHPMKPGRPQLYIYRNNDGSLWTAQSFVRGGRKLYHLAPLILDPGDRLDSPEFDGL